MRSTTNCYYKLCKLYLINIIYKYCINIKQQKYPPPKKNRRYGVPQEKERRQTGSATLVGFNNSWTFWLSTFPLACNHLPSASHSPSQEILSDQSARGLTRQTSAAAAAPKVRGAAGCCFESRSCCDSQSAGSEKKKRFYYTRHYVSFIFILYFKFSGFFDHFEPF